MRHPILNRKWKKKRIHKRRRSKSPVFGNSPFTGVQYLKLLREKCDICQEPIKGELGRLITRCNADKIFHVRYLADLCFKLYNDAKFTSFKLLKICKINNGGVFYALTFRAQEDGSEECPVFRGVCHVMGRKKEALFCEIKEDDKITLLPSDADYVCETEGLPCGRKK